MSHIMLDLETYDTAPSAVILSIGAVRFDTHNCYERIYLVCSSPGALADQAAHGRTTSASTLEWWGKQSAEARKVLDDSGSLSPEEVLYRFKEFCGSSSKVWGNGADFDNVLLRSMYTSYGALPAPWVYSANRCYRTLKSLAPNVALPEREGVHHNALDDALFQALHAQLILQSLRIQL